MADSSDHLAELLRAKMDVNSISPGTWYASPSQHLNALDLRIFSCGRTFILDLPVEIVEQIFSYLLKRHDQYNVVLACKTFQRLGTPVLYRRYFNAGSPVEVERPPTRSLWPFLRTLLERPDIRSFVKEIRIGYPRLRLGDFDRLLSFEDRVRNPIMFPQPPLAPTKQEWKKFLTETHGTISGMPDYEGISSSDDFEAILVRGLLSVTPNLEVLEIFGLHRSSPFTAPDNRTIPFEKLPRLRKFVDYWIFGEAYRFRWYHLDELFALPGLRSVTIPFDCTEPVEIKSRQLQELRMWTVPAADDEFLCTAEFLERVIQSGCTQLSTFAYDDTNKTLLYAHPERFMGNLRFYKDSLTRILIGGVSFSLRPIMTAGDMGMPAPEFDFSEFHHLQELKIPASCFEGLDLESLCPSLAFRLPDSLISLTVIHQFDQSLSEWMIAILHGLSPRDSGALSRLRDFSLEIIIFDEEDLAVLEYAEVLPDIYRPQLDSFFVRTARVLSQSEIWVSHGWGLLINRRAILNQLRAIVSDATLGYSILRFAPWRSWYDVEAYSEAFDGPEWLEEWEKMDHTNRVLDNGGIDFLSVTE